MKAFDSHQFRIACSRFPTGVAIASVMNEDGLPRGLTVSSFTSVSLDPPLILICIHKGSKLLPHFRRSWFGMNVLSEDQEELSMIFSCRESTQTNLVEWRLGRTGAPLLSNVLAVFECSVREIVTGGDHEILVAEVAEISSEEGVPLVRFSSAYHGLRKDIVQPVRCKSAVSRSYEEL
jgi:flavin reductase (DIM6/NTAB) family NADH-FMN oxidoreductase RutF